MVKKELTHSARGITPTIESGMGVNPTSIIIRTSKQWDQSKKPQEKNHYFRHFVLHNSTQIQRFEFDEKHWYCIWWILSLEQWNKLRKGLDTHSTFWEWYSRRESSSKIEQNGGRWELRVWWKRRGWGGEYIGGAWKRNSVCRNWELASLAWTGNVTPN